MQIKRNRHHGGRSDVSRSRFWICFDVSRSCTVDSRGQPAGSLPLLDERTCPSCAIGRQLDRIADFNVSRDGPSAASAFTRINNDVARAKSIKSIIANQAKGAERGGEGMLACTFTFPPFPKGMTTQNRLPVPRTRACACRAPRNTRFYLFHHHS